MQIIVVCKLVQALRQYFAKKTVKTVKYSHCGGEKKKTYVTKKSNNVKQQKWLV